MFTNSEPVTKLKDLFWARTLLNNSSLSSVAIRELKHRRFWATDVNRKSKRLLFDAYYSLFVENDKL